MSHVAPIFSARVWPQAQTLLIGALLAPGKRTVSARSPSFKPIIGSIGAPMAGNPFAPTGWIVLGLDDTIERRRGDHIRAKGIYRDPVRHHVVKASGLRWLSLMLLTPMAGRIGCGRYPL